MKYEILKDFAGSQDGTVTEQFAAGTTRDLSDYLARCINPDWAKPAGRVVEIENKAVITDGVPAKRIKAK